MYLIDQWPSLFRPTSYPLYCLRHNRVDPFNIQAFVSSDMKIDVLSSEGLNSQVIKPFDEDL